MAYAMLRDAQSRWSLVTEALATVTGTNRAMRGLVRISTEALTLANAHDLAALIHSAR
jgi:hypothetical protein